MLKQIFKKILYIIHLSMIFASSLQTPEEFLGYELGDRFSFHHDVVSYFEHIAEASNNISLIEYGETYEGRPLIVSIITHPKNKKSIDVLRKEHLVYSGLDEGKATENALAVVWLSYSVHGNESSSMEAAMKTLYSFADKSNANQTKWLEKVILIIDPCINPDGRDRYANYFRMTKNKIPDIDSKTRSHNEPWPGGRTNHYYHDLNRDWCWQSQIETKSRIELYKTWMPHVHVDYHEQSYEEPYYFAPAVEPYHALITDWQREFQKIIGDNNARHFDKNNLLYFRNEEFDLLYPGFGDTYPIFNGALGMTYEKGGSGAGGIAVKTSATDTLTLKERLEHHHITGLSTVEATYENADKVTSEFKKYFSNAQTKFKTKYKTYVIPYEKNNLNKVNDLKHLLKLNGIKYGFPITKRPQSLRNVFVYKENGTNDVNVTQNDLCIPVNQELGILTNVLFEPKTFLSDSLTYDITAWSLPYVFGLDAYASQKAIALNLKEEVDSDNIKHDLSNEGYGYLSKWESINELNFLAEILKNKITVRVAEKAFTHGDIDYGPGSLFISPRGNEHLGVKLNVLVKQAALKHKPNIASIGTGASKKGIDLGSSNFNIITKPRIGIISGNGISSNNFGEIWHFFEQQIQFPISIYNSSDFKSIPFNDLDVLILPSGTYGFLRNEVPASTQIKKETGASILIKASPPPEILKWVKSGGRLIVIGKAMEKFVDQKGYGLVKYESETSKKMMQKLNEKEKLNDRNKKYGDKKRKRLIDSIYGSIVKVKLDNTHPLGFGYDESFFSLKLEKKLYPLLPKGWNVGVLMDEQSHIAGFMGHRIKKKINNNLIFGVHEVSKGRIIYMADNPLFRSFWYNNKLLFGNALFFVTD